MQYGFSEPSSPSQFLPPLPSSSIHMALPQRYVPQYLNYSRRRQQLDRLRHSIELQCKSEQLNFLGQLDEERSYRRLLKERQLRQQEERIRRGEQGNQNQSRSLNMRFVAYGKPTKQQTQRRDKQVQQWVERVMAARSKMNQESQ